MPVPVGDGVVFGTISLLRQQPDSELKAATLEFLTVSNAVKLLHGHIPLEEILAANGQPVSRYGAALLAFSNAEVQTQIAQRNDSARMLAGADAVQPFDHTLTLLEELRDAGEWETLRQQAERYSGLAGLSVADYTKRMLALCLARSSERADQRRAVDLYQELSDSPRCEADDLAYLATLLINGGDYDRATAAVLRGIEAFPERFQGFAEIGMRIVEATGDRNLRDQLLTPRAERRMG